MEDKEYMNISAITTMQVGQILDYLVENDFNMARMGNVGVTYEGTIEDTLKGKRQVFTIVRYLND